MKFRENTGASIEQAFKEFDTNNPEVYNEFKKYAFAAIKKKKKKISAKLIINVIRWEKFMETKEKTLFTDKDGVKHKFRINDAYTAHYGRKFIKDFPALADIFNFRELRS